MNTHKPHSRRRFAAFAAFALAAFAPAGTSREARAEAPVAKGPARLEAGVLAPAFRLRALNQEMMRLDELAYPGREKKHAKKRPVFLDFFRTDCKPCLDAVPELVALHEKYAARGLHILLIALLEETDGTAKLERFLATNKFPFPVAVDANQLYAKKYLGNPVTLPATFLIDREGTIRRAKYGADGTYAEHFGSDIETLIAPPADEKKSD